MKYLGKGKITEESGIRFLSEGQMVDVYQYQNGDEIDTNGYIYDENKSDIEFRVFDGKYNFDCTCEEVDIIATE